MTGFIRGLFGGKKVKPLQPKESGGSSYFLDADEAKSFGDLDYMRTVKSVRRTFPKGVKEQNQSVSAMKVQDNSTFGQPQSESQPSPSALSSQPIAPTFGNTSSMTSSSSDRRKTDTNMDMFRDMAKQVRR